MKFHGYMWRTNIISMHGMDLCVALAQETHDMDLCEELEYKEHGI